MAAPVHVYEIFIRATPETVWEALVDPAATTQYFHQVRYESTFEPGSPYRQVLPDGRVAVDGVVEEFDPPRRLVITWHVRYDPALEEEPPSRVEWTLVPATDDGSVTRVTLRHGDLGRSPLTWARVRLGWVEILDSLKSLLETGRPLDPVDTGDRPLTDDETTGDGTAGDPDQVVGHWHRSTAVEANNSVWELLERADRSAADDEEMLRRAYAAAYHWDRAAGRSPANEARATWLLARVWAEVGDGSRALDYADRTMATCTTHGLGDFDLAYAHEARARALAALGLGDDAAAELDRARAVPVADPQDRAIVDADLRALAAGSGIR